MDLARVPWPYLSATVSSTIRGISNSRCGTTGTTEIATSATERQTTASITAKPLPGRAPPEAAAITDVDGNLERSLVVCDFGPGDEWHIPISACMNQTREGYAIRTNSSAREMLPTGTRLSVMKADSSIEPLKPTETRGARKVFQTH